MIFHYQALNRKGENISDYIDAPSETVPATRYAARILPVKITQHEIVNGGKEKSSGRARELLSRISTEISIRFSSRQVGLFSRQLATLLRAGMPLLNAITDIIDQIENKHFRNVVADIREKLEEGSSFSKALSRHSTIFSDMYVNMVRVGENLGSLDHVVKRLAEMEEKRNILKSKVQAALYYPLFMLIFATVVVIFLLVNVIPAIAEIFKDQQQALPLPTEIVMGLSKFLSHFWFLLPLFILGVYYLFRRYAGTPNGRRKIDEIKLKVPLFKTLYHKMIVLRFTQNLGVLLTNKVDLIKSFEIVQKIVGNLVVEEKISEATKKIKEGSSMAQSLNKSEFLPRMVLGMISAGAASDNLDNMLVNIGKVYETELDLTISSLTSLIEPLIIIFMGVVIGMIVLSVMLPLMEMNLLVQ
jgi:general secretion pathway protein F